MFLGGVPAQRSRGTTFDLVRIAAKHRPALRKFRLDKSGVNKEKRLRLFEIYRKQILKCYFVF